MTKKTSQTATSTIYWQLDKYYYYFINRGFTPGKAQRIVKRFLSYLYSQNGIEINHLLKEHKALTITEITIRTGISKQVATYIIQAFLDAELIEHRAYVEPPYTSREGGRRPRIYSLIGTDQENITEAQRRYAVYSNEELRKEQQKKKADEEESIKDKTRRDALISQVIEDLVIPPDKMVPLFDSMKKLGVSQEDQLYVKNGVMDWMQKTREGSP